MQEALQLKRLANKRAPPWLFLHEYTTVKPPLVRAEAGRINDALNYLALPSLIRVKQLFLLILVDFFNGLAAATTASAGDSNIP